MVIKKTRRCVRLAESYLKMAQEARNLGKYYNSIMYSTKATKFYNLVFAFNNKVIMILCAITVILQIITLIIK